MSIITSVNTYKKRFASLLAVMVLAAGLVLAPTASAISIGGPSDCDDNAIIRCGAHSTGAIINSYNSSAYVRKVFTFFGISAADMSNLPSTDVAGRVTKDGKVFIEGQSRAVATGAITGGRQNIAGSTKVNFQGAVFFKRPPSVSFQQESLPAFVSMKNGVFQFAVIASCGNAVRATPVAPPQTSVAPAKPVSRPQPHKPQPVKPKPQPAPTPAPTQTQSQEQNQTVTQNVTQNQEVTVNNTSSSSAQAQEEETPVVPETVAAAAPAQALEETAAAPQPAAGKDALPNVGPEGTAGAFFVSTLLGIAGYRRHLLRGLGG